MPTESCLNQGRCEATPDGNGECKLRKQPQSGPREEKVPYLIISSHNEKHTARGFYMAAAAGVGFPLARVRLVRGLIGRAFWLIEATWWWRDLSAED
eukprot:superscaffoldBa00010116_g24518